MNVETLEWTNRVETVQAVHLVDILEVAVVIIFRYIIGHRHVHHGQRGQGGCSHPPLLGVLGCYVLLSSL